MLYSFYTVASVADQYEPSQKRKDMILRFYHVLNEQTLLYGSECWTLGKAGELVASPYVRFLRTLIRVRRIVHVRNGTFDSNLEMAPCSTKVRPQTEGTWITDVSISSEGRNGV